MRGFEAKPDYVWALLSSSRLGLSSPTTARFMSKNGNTDDNYSTSKCKSKKRSANVDRNPVFDGSGVPPYVEHR